MKYDFLFYRIKKINKIIPINKDVLSNIELKIETYSIACSYILKKIILNKYNDLRLKDSIGDSK